MVPQATWADDERILGGRVELRGALMASAATEFTVVWAVPAYLIFNR
jgi:hypothetical protein